MAICGAWKWSIDSTCVKPLLMFDEAKIGETKKEDEPWGKGSDGISPYPAKFQYGMSMIPRILNSSLGH